MKKSIVLLVLGLIVGCGSEPAKPPYRGRLFKNVKLSGALQARLIETQRFDPSKNCVQMVTRDTIESGIRRTDRVLILAPDACPTNGEVAARESDSMRFVRVNSVDTDNLPARAYDLVKGSTPVGAVNVVSRDNELELVDLCTFSAYSPYCDLEITHDGRFSRVNTDRAPIGQHASERAALAAILNRIDGAEANLVHNMSLLQRNIFQQISASTHRLQNFIATEERAAALTTMTFVGESLQRLEANVVGNQNAAIASFASETRRNLEQLRREILATIRTQVEFHTNRIEGILSANINLARDSVVTRLRLDLVRLGAVLAANEWITATTLFAGISWRLQQVERNVNEHTTAVAAVEFLGLWWLMDGYSRQITSSLRAEIRANTGVVITTLIASNAWLTTNIWLSQGLVIGQLRALETSLSGQLTTLSAQQLGQTLFLLGNLWGAFGVLSDQMNQQERNLILGYQATLQRYAAHSIERIKRDLLLETRTTRGALRARHMALGVVPPAVFAALDGAHTALGRLDEQLIGQQWAAAYATALDLERSLRTALTTLGDRLTETERDQVSTMIRMLVLAIGAAPEDLRRSMPAAARAVVTAIGGIDGPTAQVLQIGTEINAFAAHVEGGPGRPSLERAALTRLRLAALRNRLAAGPTRDAAEALYAMLSVYDRATLRHLSIEVRSGAMQINGAAPAEPLAALRDGLTNFVVTNPAAAPQATLRRLEAEAARLFPQTTVFTEQTRHQLLLLSIALRQLGDARSTGTILTRSLIELVEAFSVQAIRPTPRLLAVAALGISLGEKIAAGNQAQIRAAVMELYILLNSQDFNDNTLGMAGPLMNAERERLYDATEAAIPALDAAL